MGAVSQADTWLVQRVSLKDKHGLHMRPAQRIVETAENYRSDVRAVKDHLDLNAKSILDMLEFAAYMVNEVAHGDSEFDLQAQGADAEEALAALAHLVDDGFGLE